MAEERDEDDALSQQQQEDEAPVPKTKKPKGKRTGLLTPSATNVIHF